MAILKAKDAQGHYTQVPIIRDNVSNSITVDETNNTMTLNKTLVLSDGTDANAQIQENTNDITNIQTDFLRKVAINSDNTISISAGGNAIFNFTTPNIAGYTPIMACYRSNSASGAITMFKQSGDISTGSFAINVHNYSTINIADVSISADVLYMKTFS